MPLFWFKVLNEIKIHRHEKYLKYDLAYSRVQIKSDNNVLLEIKVKIKKTDDYYIGIIFNRIGIFKRKN